jgi:hypothetical protein
MLRIEVEEETDGRFIAEVPDLPGVMAYGQSRGEAIVKSKHWRCGSSRIGWNTVNRFRDSRRSFPRAVVGPCGSASVSPCLASKRRNKAIAPYGAVAVPAAGLLGVVTDVRELAPRDLTH